MNRRTANVSAIVAVVLGLLLLAAIWTSSSDARAPELGLGKARAATARYLDRDVAAGAASSYTIGRCRRVSARRARCAVVEQGFKTEILLDDEPIVGTFSSVVDVRARGRWVTVGFDWLEDDVPYRERLR
jgi:hypothetical protein